MRGTPPGGCAGVGCMAIAHSWSLLLPTWIAVRGSGRWPLRSPTPREKNGLSYVEGRIDDLDENQLHEFARRTGRGLEDVDSRARILRATGFVRLPVAEVRVLRCPGHRGPGGGP